MLGWLCINIARTFCSSHADRKEEERPTVISEHSITPLLIHSPKINWPSLVNLMRLKDSKTLGFWFEERLKIETPPANNKYSFELTAVAFWLGARRVHQIAPELFNSYNEITSQNKYLYIIERLVAYLVARKNTADKEDNDCYQLTLFNYAIIGAPEMHRKEFTAKGIEAGLTLNSSENSKLLLKQSPQITQLNRTLTRGNIRDFAVHLNYLSNPRNYHGDLRHSNPQETLRELIWCGHWHSTLLSIVGRYCNPMQTNIIPFYYEESCSGEFGQKVKQQWQAINAAGGSRAALNRIAQNPDVPELVFAYFVFRYTEAHRLSEQRNEYAQAAKQFFADNINVTLQNCKEPLFAIIELLAFSPVELILELTPETKELLRPFVRDFYPLAEEFICDTEDVQQRNAVHERQTEHSFSYRRLGLS